MKRMVCNRWLITMLLVGIACLGMSGCKAAREKRKQFNQATTAAVNATLFANPLAAVYAHHGGDQSRFAVRVAAADNEECPIVSFQGLLAPFAGAQSVTVAYGDDCLSHGLSISGAVTGEWAFELSRFKVYLDLLLTMDALTIEGLSTSGQMRALATLDSRGPVAELDGQITTTHADGRSRELVVDNMTAHIDFNEVLLSLFFDADEDLDDETLLNPYDDVLVMNGAATFTDEDGRTHALTFDNCTQNFFCFYPSSGTITLLSEEAEEGFEAVIDLGEGACDSLITVTIDGESREIDLEEWLNRSGIQF